jgi:predicted PurR-regulated permease PerM
MGEAQGRRSPDLARTTFQLLALGALIATIFWILRPFLAALTWATTIVVATWPLLRKAQAWLGGRRSAAVALMTTALLMTLLVPLYLGITSIVSNAQEIASWSKSLAKLSVPQPPAWAETVPLIGAKLTARWQEVAARSPEEIAARLSPLAHKLALWFVGQVGGAGMLLAQFLLTVVIAGILYARGETAARGVERFARRLAGPEGVNAVGLAAQAVRAVALGVVVTAILQSGLAGVGFAIAGVPFAAILTALAFILAVAQVGAGPVLIGAVIWVYAAKGAGWGTVFLVWAIFCGTFDNFLRPLLIKRGADLPLLLIFAGVVGGLIAFGVIGLFIGPVVLAVAYKLLIDWMSEDGQIAGGGGPPSPAGEGEA